MRLRTAWVLACLVAVVAVAAGGLLPVPSGPAAAAAAASEVSAPLPPDIIVILTDDQRVGTEQAMPYTWSFFSSQGVHYPEAQVPTNLCCPARASLLTGQYAHTTGVWENSGDNGGYKAFQRWDGPTLPKNLQDAGYDTALFGKYINRYNRSGGRGLAPAGWDVFHTYDDPRADGGYWTPLAGLPFGYTTDVIGDAVVNHIATAAPDKPMFTYVSPYAPHAPYDAGPYQHAADYARLLAFRAAGDLDNPSSREKDVSDKPSWIRRLPRGGNRALRLTADRQSRTLMGVDANVQKIIEAQATYRNLDNTVIVYLTDNGVAWGDHRLRLKRHPYGLASRIPLLIKYPVGTVGAEQPGTQSMRLVNQLDVTATLAQLAGARPTGVGRSLLGAPRIALPLEASPSRGGQLNRPGFCGIRTKRYMYLHYSDGTQELYDYRRDPYELTNRAYDGRYWSRGLRLDSRLDPGCNLTEIAAMPGRGGDD